MVARKGPQQLLGMKYNSIFSKSTADIGRTNLIELDIPTEGPPVASKPYTVPLKCTEFVKHEIKQLEETGIICRSMSDWASPKLVIPKKEEQAGNSSESSTTASTNNNKPNNNKFNIRLCIGYRKLNSCIMTARQIKADGSLGKVTSNYPLPTINNSLARFNRCKFFSTKDLRFSYYHIWLTKEAAEKTVFITDKGKWIFHSLQFGNNIGPSAFSYVLGKVLMQSMEFALNYLDDIMISSTCEEHLEHLI